MSKENVSSQEDSQPDRRDFIKTALLCGGAVTLTGIPLASYVILPALKKGIQFRALAWSSSATAQTLSILEQALPVNPFRAVGDGRRRPMARRRPSGPPGLPTASAGAPAVQAQW